MKRTWAISPPVEVRSRTIEDDDDKDGQRDANGVRHAMTT
jgi:hypothetical protein